MREGVRQVAAVMIASAARRQFQRGAGGRLISVGFLKKVPKMHGEAKKKIAFAIEADCCRRQKPKSKAESKSTGTKRSYNCWQ